VAGTGLTAPGRFADGERGRVHWFAPGQWLIAGEGAETVTGLAERLSGEAAVTDLSDGWVMMALIGAAAREVMARLVPVDVSAEAFPEGRLARTPLGHIPALVTAIPGGFGLTVPRSFADSAVHEITRAMGFVAAREAD
jgi:sarcosine oxidase subunit gamma